jgi:hypothetical protein
MGGDVHAAVPEGTSAKSIFEKSISPEITHDAGSFLPAGWGQRWSRTCFFAKPTVESGPLGEGHYTSSWAGLLAVRPAALESPRLATVSPRKSSGCGKVRVSASGVLFAA